MNKKACSLYALLVVPFLCLAVNVDQEEDIADLLLTRFRLDATYIREGLDFDGNVIMTNNCVIDVPAHLEVLGHGYDVTLKMTNDFCDMVMYELKNSSTHKPVAAIDVADYSSTSNALDNFCLRLCYYTLPMDALLASYTATNISGVALFSEQSGRNETGWTNNVFAIYGRSSVQVRSSSNAVDIALAVIEAGTRKEESAQESEASDDGN